MDQAKEPEKFPGNDEGNQEGKPGEDKSRPGRPEEIPISQGRHRDRGPRRHGKKRGRGFRDSSKGREAQPLPILQAVDEPPPPKKTKEKRERVMLKKTIEAFNRISTKTKVSLIVLLIIGLMSSILAGSIFDTVEKGTYQIKQAAITGEMSTKLEPGLWLQLFGDIQVWPKAETFYFTADSQEGESRDQSIEIRFNDGSICRISGTCRVVMPVTEQQTLDLVLKEGYRSHDDLQQKLILPVIRNSLRLTANLMSSRESYSDMRSDFIFWAWDQIQNGLYETSEETRKVKDLVSGEMVTKTFKIISKDETGRPIYQKNPFEGLGIKLSNFEVKTFVYSDKVRNQIEQQQEAFMAVATARANAQKAEQDALTEKAKGKNDVMKAKYVQEVEKTTAVVKAEADKETAEIQAQKEVTVAKLQKERAIIEAERQKAVAETDSKKKIEVEKLAKEEALVEANKQKEVAQTLAQKEIEVSKLLKERALVDAARDKEVAETLAKKKLEVAKLDEQAAEHEKQREILLGQGQAEKKKLIYQADNYMKEKIEAFRDAYKQLADALSKRKVPTVVIGGDLANQDKATMDQFGNAMMMLVLDKLGVDMGIDKELKGSKMTPKFSAR